jgi:hypothetical protein
MGGAAALSPGPARLDEASRLSWRRRASAATLRRDDRRWTLWTTAVAVTFAAPSLVLVWLEPLMLPVALVWSAHGYAVCRMQAGRAVRAVVPVGAPRSAAYGTEGSPGEVALGLLGDLLGHRERDLMARTGLTLERGRLGIWLLGERGALLMRPGGRRLDSFCVRVEEDGDLPAGDRVAHLLLALREDEEGFLTVANMNFSGAAWRCRRRMEPGRREALGAARAALAANG